MKKLFLFITLFLMSATALFADEQRNVKLDEEHPNTVERFAFCNVFVSMTNHDDDGNANISVAIENLDESSVLILFGHAYPENELKRLKPSIIYDKRFPGTKGYRSIETYEDLKDVIFIGSSEKSLLPDIQLKNGEHHSCRLPLYIATYKNSRRTKLTLMEKQIIELDIDVDLKPDTDYPQLVIECDTLVAQIGRQQFCSHRKHRPSLQVQEKPFRDRIENLKTKIDSLIRIHNWYSSDKGYQMYSELKTKLDDIDFSLYEQDCGKHDRPVPPRECKYCRLSPQDIYHRLDDIYKRIYSSNNRKAEKAAVMSDVKLLYGCRRHSPGWQRSEYKSKIMDRYTRINNF